MSYEVDHDLPPPWWRELIHACDVNDTQIVEQTIRWSCRIWANIRLYFMEVSEGVASPRAIQIPPHLELGLWTGDRGGDEVKDVRRKDIEALEDIAAALTYRKRISPVPGRESTVAEWICKAAAPRYRLNQDMFHRLPRERPKYAEMDKRLGPPPRSGSPVAAMPVEEMARCEIQSQEEMQLQLLPAERTRVVELPAYGAWRKSQTRGEEPPMSETKPPPSGATTPRTEAKPPPKPDPDERMPQLEGAAWCRRTASPRSTVTRLKANIRPARVTFRPETLEKPAEFSWVHPDADVNTGPLPCPPSGIPSHDELLEEITRNMEDRLLGTSDPAEQLDYEDDERALE
jgi:hypothetical protein